ncbi:MAG: GNAT family N-acetyltransferase [Eubacteriales bacterium]
MIYRIIEKEELKAFANLSATAFHCDATEQYKDIEDGGFLLETIRVIADAENNFTAGLRLIELEMYLDTGYVKCGGIGDVSSYPEYRRGGNVSELMKNVLREMYENKYVISYLYPFSHPFYRKYGYELCREKRVVTIKTSDIKYTKSAGYAKQHIYKTKDDLSEDIKKIYYKHADGMNFMLDRNEYFWEKKLKEDAFTSKTKTYVLYSEENQPIAYFTYEYEKIVFPNIRAKIYDIAFVDRKAFDSLLMFIYKLGPAVSEIVFACPPRLNIFNTLEDAWNVKMSVEPGGMMRIINAKMAFEAMKAVELKSSLLIKVQDNYISENNAVFRVECKSGKITAEKADGEAYDLCLPVNILAQAISGYAALDEVEHTEGVTIRAKKEELDKLFYKKHIHLQDFF